MISTMVKQCEQCRKDFEYPDYGNWPGRFCSRKCLYNSMRVHAPTSCLTCGKEVRKRKYCSRDCYAKSLKGKRPVGLEKLIGKPAWNKGQPGLENEAHPQWKGEAAGYGAIHSWVTRKLGRPLLCEHCGKTEGKFQWSNISRTYKRDLSDWQRLCQSCHGIYDRKMKRQGY